MKLKNTLVPFIFLAVSCVAARAESWGAGLAGIYLTVDGGAQVTVTEAHDGTYTGKITWLRDDKARLDKNNPAPERRGDPVLGLVILRGLTANNESRRWEGGTIYDPKNGKTYDAFAWRDPDKPGVLFLKGYVLGITWLGRSTTWTEEKAARE
jgi:uncharacterized protein (DUF2147 family)